MVVVLSVINHSVQPVGEPMVTKRKRYRESEFVIRQIKRCHFRQIKTGLLEYLIMV